MFKRIINYGLILAGVLSISSSEIVKAAEDKRLVAHPSFSTPKSWQYQKLDEKECWLVVCYQPENWVKAGMEKEPFLTESCYRVPFPEKGTSGYKKLLSMDNPIMLEKRKVPESGFPLVTENIYGPHGGKLILTTPDYLYVKGSKNKMLKLFSYLIKRSSDELLPFSLEGEVEYLVNKTKNSIIITILNNKVTKAALEKPVIREEDTEDVRISFKEGTDIRKAEEWLTGKRIDRKSSTFAVTVPAGEVRIVEFNK